MGVEESVAMGMGAGLVTAVGADDQIKELLVPRSSEL